MNSNVVDGKTIDGKAIDKAVAQVYESPRLYKQLHALLEDEKARRQRFHAELQKWEGKKVEFINGRLVTDVPIKQEHLECGGRLVTLLRAYVSLNKLGFLGYEKMTIALTRNDYEPDICFFGNEKASLFFKGQLKFSAPDFIVEILSQSTEHVDRGVKFEDYVTQGVKEYWIIDPLSAVLEQYLLDEPGERYTLALETSTGTVSSPVITGLHLPVKAIFDDAENIAALQELLKG
jgi:Uma2 family endonuclease